MINSLNGESLLINSGQVGDSLFHLLINSVKDYAIFALDPNGIVTTWNCGAERMKGYCADEIIGQHFSVFYPPEAIALGRPKHGLDVALIDGTFKEEGWRQRKDGTRMWASIEISPMRDSDGSLRGFAKVIRDITERSLFIAQVEHSRQDQMALMVESQRALEQAQKVAKIGNWELDLITWRTRWSKQLFSVLGLDPAQDDLGWKVFQSDIVLKTPFASRRRKNSRSMRGFPTRWICDLQPRQTSPRDGYTSLVKRFAMAQARPFGW